MMLVRSLLATDAAWVEKAARACGAKAVAPVDGGVMIERDGAPSALVAWRASAEALEVGYLWREGPVAGAFRELMALWRAIVQEAGGRRVTVMVDVESNRQATKLLRCYRRLGFVPLRLVLGR